MLGHSIPRRFALLLALTSSLFAAQAAEVSSAERVETTPGLSPDAVRGVFNRRRQELARCMRLTYLRKVDDPKAKAHSRDEWENVVWKELPSAALSPPWALPTSHRRESSGLRPSHAFSPSAAPAWTREYAVASRRWASSSWRMASTSMKA